jgi:hemoglobin
VVRESIVDELGGRPAVAATVDDLYRRLLSDPAVAPYFRQVEMKRIRAHMTDFLVAALDGPDRYRALDLTAAHGDLGVTDAAFDVTAGHLLDALEHRKVRPELLDSVLERIAPYRSSVVTRSDAAPTWVSF